MTHLKSLFATILISSTLLLSACGDDDAEKPKGIGGSFAAGLQSMSVQNAIPELDTTETLGGIDADADGLRDDVKIWIDTLDVDDNQRQLVIDNAKAIQTIMLVDLKDKLAVKNVATNSILSVVCMVNGFKEDPASANTIRRNIETYTANTASRHNKYVSYNMAISTAAPKIPTCPSPAPTTEIQP